MNKNIIIAILVICIIVLVGWIIYDNANNHNIKVIVSDNIEETAISIDKYYLMKLNEQLSTIELANIAEQYMNAWKNELTNVVSVIKQDLVFIEDKQIFDDYYQQYQQLALSSAEAEHLKYVDINESIDNRFAGTGSSYATTLAMKDVYKEGAISLIKYYNNFKENNSYQYIFEGEI